MFTGMTRGLGWRQRVMLLVGVAVLLLAACGPAAQEATPTRSVAPTAAPTSAPPTTAAPSGTAPTATPAAKPTVAPAATAKYGGTLRVYNRDSPLDWDFHKQITGSRHLRNIHHSVFSGVAGEGVREPCVKERVLDLAQSWRWVDDTTFEVKLIPGAKFHNKPPVNGREVTAEDVVWSWKRIFAVNPRMEKVSAFNKDIVAVDRYTVRFLQTQPTPALPDMLGIQTTSSVVAKEAGDFSKDKQWGDWSFPDKSYVGSGPFMLKDVVSGVKVVTVKHPDYFKKGLPYVDQLEFITVPDQSTRLASVIAGKLDLWFAETAVATALTAQKVAPNLTVQGCPVWEPLVVFFNEDEAPFNDVRVRRAALMSMDQASLIKTAFLGQANPSGIAPPLSTWYMGPKDFPPELGKYLTFNPAESKKLLAEAGHPSGVKTVFNYFPGYGSPYNEAAEALVAMLRQAGIEADLKGWERGVYNNMKADGKYQGLFATKTSGIENPLEYLLQFHSRVPVAQNTGHTKDPEMDKLVDAFATTLDENKMKDLAKQIQYRMLDQAHVLQPPGHFDYSIAQPYVKGFVKGGREQNSRFWAEKVWLDK